MKNINIYDTVYFLMNNTVVSSEVVGKTTIESADNSQFHGQPTVRISIEVDRNPLGSQYKKIFDINEVYLSKEDLVADLIKNVE